MFTSRNIILLLNEIFKYFNILYNTYTVSGTVCMEQSFLQSCSRIALLPTLLSACKQFLVASISGGADDDLDDGRAFVRIHPHVLDCGLLVQPTVDEGARLLWMVSYSKLKNAVRKNSSHLNCGVLRSTSRSKMCFPVEFTICSSTAFFSSSRPRSSRADMGSTWGSVN